jgi:osmoprotectant transport system permease protein
LRSRGFAWLESVQVWVVFFFLLGALVPYLDSKGENSGKDLNRIKISLLFIPFVLVVFFVATGMASHLGFIKEWAIKPDLFWGKVGGHLRISIFALGLAVFLGIPLAHYAFQSRAFESLINPALNITQTIPSLVFFGFFMTMIFGALTVFPWLSNLGIASTGDTPVILALGVYALFPITKNTLVAFRSVNPEVVEAARGMGYTSSQIWKNIRLPLSLPILLGGVRIALVQTLGGAVLAKLINGDGLGYYVIEGLYTRVNDMAILGVISLIGLTLVVELCFAYIQRSFDPLNRPDNSFVNGPRDTEGGKT